MTRRWKQILTICAGFVFTICPLFMGHMFAVGRMEPDTSRLLSSFELRLADRWNAFREQPANQKGTALTPGSWGGQHISLEITADGARAEYDCAHGTISRKVSIDRRGRFNVPGTYVAEHGGPVREGEQSNSIPVRFSGRVSGKRMHLTVRRQDSGKLIGNFTLVDGQEASLVKCR